MQLRQVKQDSALAKDPAPVDGDKERVHQKIGGSMTDKGKEPV